MTIEEKTDFLIALHTILEAGLHGLYRQIFFYFNHSFNQRDNDQPNKYLDSMSFKDKTIALIYYSSFIFPTEEERELAIKYQNIIGKIINFSGIRNSLLHGHSISETSHIDQDGSQKKRFSDVSKKLNSENIIEQQIVLFKEIIEGVHFYIMHLDKTLTQEGRLSMLKQYIDTEFLQLQ